MFSRRYVWLGFVIALLSVAVIASARLLLEAHAPTGHAPFQMFAIAVLIAGIFGGFLPALLATFLSLLAIDLLFLEPLYRLDFSDRTYALQHILFALSGLVIALLSELYHRNQREARLWRSELESRVEHRTAQLATANQQLIDEVYERTAAEKSLQIERNSLNALLESLQDGIIACDAEGRIVRCNAAAMRLCGIDNPKSVTQDWWQQLELYDPVSDRRLAGEDWPLARVLREGRYDEEELVLVGPDATRRVVSVSGRTIHDDDGTVIGGVISLHDVTDIVEARQRLTDLILELQRSNRELQDFASVASHDLQEPLRKIQAFGDRLQTTQGERLSEQGKDYLARMHNAAGRMQVLINDLLAFSRVTTKALPFERIDLKPLIDEVIDDLEDRLDRTGGTVEVGELHDLQADPLQMRQLLQNLLSNALKFRKPGLAPRVHVSATLQTDEQGDEWLELRVADNGIGFEEKYLDRIFNIFQRLHGRTEYEGTGVGLAVCRKIVERHGGHLTAESRPGEGATFVVALPRYQREVEPIHAGA